MATEVTSDYIFNLEELNNHAKVYAGPGAGKTHFLVENIKNIIESNQIITKSKMRKVLCVTYTNAAVDEIKRRLNRYDEYVEIYTIHSFIIEHIIRPFQQDIIDIMLSDFGITVDNKGAISSQIEGLGILHGVDKSLIYNFICEDCNLNPLENNFTYSKKAMGEVEVDNNKFITSVVANQEPISEFTAPKTIDNNHIVSIKKYLWSVVRKLTHNEILYFGYRVLQKNPTALYALRVKYPFIFVDEFQDTNPLQTLLIKLIGEKSTFICIVGDIAQSIYSFQGAHPSDFANFSIDGEKKTNEYVISGNRRSTKNIVNFCNFLRKSDGKVKQVSIRQYNSEDDKQQIENNKVHFLIGNTTEVTGKIREVILDNGVILTRAWAAAFDYIQDVDQSQIKLLKSVYYSYSNSPIQIRDEIVEHNNVMWVKAFRFIFTLWESYNNGSFIDAFKAFKLYTDVDVKKITPQILMQLKNLLYFVFQNLSEEESTHSVICKFNEKIMEPQFSLLREICLGINFSIPIFDELDKEKLVSSVSGLCWRISYKLFTEVFSDNSKYMTVHQAKGLEWDKVIVSVNPTRFDNIKISNLYSNPYLTQETASDEFTRMYYVACSRAKNELYIHLPNGTEDVLKNSFEDYFPTTDLTFDYDIIQ